jgi:hypothetical protein
MPSTIGSMPKEKSSDWNVTPKSVAGRSWLDSHGRDICHNQISKAAQGQGFVATSCEQEQHMAAVAALFQGCFNPCRYIPVDGERTVKVEGHDVTIHI